MTLPPAPHPSKAAIAHLSHLTRDRQYKEITDAAQKNLAALPADLFVQVILDTAKDRPAGLDTIMLAALIHDLCTIVTKARTSAAEPDSSPAESGK
jgi:hypothetical protein